MMNFKKSPEITSPQSKRNVLNLRYMAEMSGINQHSWPKLSETRLLAYGVSTGFQGISIITSRIVKKSPGIVIPDPTVNKEETDESDNNGRKVTKK